MKGLSDNGRRVWETAIWIFGVCFVAVLITISGLAQKPALFVFRMEMDNNTAQAVQKLHNISATPQDCPTQFKSYNFNLTGNNSNMKLVPV